MRGYECHGDDIVGLALHIKPIGQHTILLKCHGVHGVAEEANRPTNLTSGPSPLPLPIGRGVDCDRAFTRVNSLPLGAVGVFLLLPSLWEGLGEGPKHRKVSWVVAHQVFPFAAGQLVVVVVGKLVDAVVGGLTAAFGLGNEAGGLGGVAKDGAVGIAAGALGLEQFLGMGGSGLYGVLYGGKIGITQGGTHGGGNLLHLTAQTEEAALETVALRLGPVGIAHGRQTAGVHLLIQLHLCPPHEFGTADAAEAIELAHDGEQAAACLVAKLAAEPSLIVVAERLMGDAVDVPCHVEEQLQLVARHLGVVHVSYPQAARVVVVGLPHLAVDESRLGGGQPQIVVRPPPVGKVVIHTGAALPLLFAGVGEVGDVAIVVVAPHQRDIVGHPQSFLVELQHLLVGHEYLHQA